MRGRGGTCASRLIAITYIPPSIWCNNNWGSLLQPAPLSIALLGSIMVLASSTDDFGAFGYSYTSIHELTSPQPSLWSLSPERLARNSNLNMLGTLTHSRLACNKWLACFMSQWSVLLTLVQVSEGYMTWATVEVGVFHIPT
jgi:hypothetical protein